LRALDGAIRISLLMTDRSPDGRGRIRRPTPISLATAFDPWIILPRPLGRSCPMTALVPAAASSVRRALARSCQPELRALTVLEFDERIEIGGRVSSYYLKSVALETAKAASDGRSVVLNIEVDQ
jgi:hypothetical protein